MATAAPSIQTRSDLTAKLNATHHFQSLTFYLIVVAAHWMEHGAQAVQIYLLRRTPQQSLGLIGSAFPVLVSSELLHWGYAAFMLAGLVLLRQGFRGTARTWWNVALGIQIWHFIEHLLLLVQALSGKHLLGRPVPTSLIQLLIPRVELHLIYNMIVLIPLLIAVSLHWFLKDGMRDRPADACSCAGRFDVS